ncbi:MAG: helix-turn-helix transcriptional regulator [Rhodoferax sp.]|nr:helix-turn-helix transcriptional regulator [Rhodoferax sp.]
MQSRQAVRTLAALAHDARLAVFKLLVAAGPGGLAAGVIAQSLAITPSALSFHLKELTQAGLLTAIPDGRRIRYAADFSAMRGLVDHLTANCCGGARCAWSDVAVACA